MHTHRRSISRYASAIGGAALALFIGAAPVTQAAPRNPDEFFLSVGVAAMADTASRDDGVDTYKLTVTNREGGQVKGITLSVPVAAGYELAGASFSQDDAWVSSRDGGQATIRIEGMAGVGDTVEATLSFTGPAGSATNALTQRATVRWGTSDERSTSQSNLPVYGVQPLTATPTGPAQVGLSGGTFAANEPVTFWYTTAAGASTPLVVVDGVLSVAPAQDDDDDDSPRSFKLADSSGVVAATLSTAGIPAGTYTVAARGGWSDALASATVRVP